MLESTNNLPSLLDRLSQQARASGLTDTEWSARAGVRKETLSRLRRRATCDFATLVALAAAVNARLGLLESAAIATTEDGHFPLEVNRDYEERLVTLCASRTLDVTRWAALGPRFFMAGLAVLLASVTGFDRRGLIELAEQLHPGASEVPVFQRWLDRSPVRPSRFLPFVDVEAKRAS